MAPIKALRALARKLGSKKAAERLHVSHKTVTEALRSGTVPKRVDAEKAWKHSERASKGWETRRENLYIREERAAIQTPPTGVPGYGPQKISRALERVRNWRGENANAVQDIKHIIKGLEKRNMAVDPELPQELERRIRADLQLRQAELNIAPSQTIEERLYRVNNIDKEYRDIARMFNLSARAVYTLYYSPPAGPLA